MNAFLTELRLNVRMADVLDVAVLAIFLYLSWNWIERRATTAGAVALLSLGALYALSQTLQMYFTAAVFHAGLTVVFLALVVIFQEDLRHAFNRLLTWRPFSGRTPGQPKRSFVDTLLECAGLFSDEKIGALIVLPGQQSLEHYLRGGVPVDGLASVELLHSVFHSASRGHDGAVLIDHDRVERLGVQLPLTSNMDALGPRGTRHAAALGLSERTDALVLVVSEERGTISVAQRNELRTMESLAELENVLLSFFRSQSTDRSAETGVWSRARRALVPLGSVSAAVLLWYLFAFRVETVQRTFENVPIEFRNVGDAATLENIPPSSAQITLVGSQRAFDAFDPTSLKIAIDLVHVSPGTLYVPIGEEQLKLPEGIHLREAVPSAVRVQLDETRNERRPTSDRQ